MSEVDLDRRLAALEMAREYSEGRLASVEKAQKESREEFTQLLVELRVLQTRVTMYAGAIAVVASIITSLSTKFLGG